MGQGPRLTARTVATDPATEIADWHFKLGEIELFGAPGLSGWHASNSHTRWNMAYDNGASADDCMVADRDPLE